VTIWGQSAGAGSVLQHVVANGGNTNPPLFQAAMTSSTFLPSQYKYNDQIPETIYNDTVSLTGCALAEDTLKCLREVEVDKLQAANNRISSNTFFGSFILVPVVDGTLITDRPTQLLKERKVNGKALYAVTNSMEGVPFVNQTMVNPGPSNFLTQLFPEFGNEEISAGVAAYAGQELSDVQLANQIMGDSIFTCPTYFLLNAFEKNAFKSEFAIPPALHANDVVYYFPGIGTPSYTNPDFAKAFSENFLNFAISLDPNTKWDPSNITPSFPMWGDALNEMLFNKTDVGSPDIGVIKTSTNLLKRCAYWESVSAAAAQ